MNAAEIKAMGFVVSLFSAKTTTLHTSIKSLSRDGSVLTTQGCILWQEAGPRSSQIVLSSGPTQRYWSTKAN